MKVQPLKVLDAPVLRDLLQWSRPSESVSLARCQDILSDTRTEVIAAIQDNIPVGILVAYVIPRFQREVMFLYEIDVHANHRKIGVATQMIELLKARCREQAISEIFVFTNTSNTAAMKLYERTGGKRPNQDDVMFSYELRD